MNGAPALTGSVSQMPKENALSADSHQIAAWLRPTVFLLDADVLDRRHALETAARAIADECALDWVPISSALWRREQAASTALGNGFAIPHARVPGLEEPMVAFVRTRVALPFGAPDGKPVSELLVILVPSGGDKDDHLRLLALVVSLFSERQFRAEVHEASSVETAGEAFRSGIARAVARQPVS